MRDFVILQRPGMIPERKGPWTTTEAIAEFVREVIAQEPQTVCIVLEMGAGDPWPEHGGEWLAMYDAAKPRRRAAPETREANNG